MKNTVLENKVIAGFKKLSKEVGYPVHSISLSQLQNYTGKLDKKELAGLASWGGRVSVNFTHGLEEVSCKDEKRTLRVK